MGFPLPKTALRNWYAGWPTDLYNYLVSLVSALNSHSGVPVAINLGTAGGVVQVPARSATLPSSPVTFLATPSGTLLAAPTYVLPDTYKAGDIIKFVFTYAQLDPVGGVVNVTLQDATGPTTIAEIYGAKVSTTGGGYGTCQVQFNGTAWVVVSAGCL